MSAARKYEVVTERWLTIGIITPPFKSRVIKRSQFRWLWLARLVAWHRTGLTPISVWASTVRVARPKLRVIQGGKAAPTPGPAL